MSVLMAINNEPSIIQRQVPRDRGKSHEWELDYFHIAVLLERPSYPVISHCWGAGQHLPHGVLSGGRICCTPKYVATDISLNCVLY